MHLLWINLLLLALTVGAPAQPVCDPTTQYEVKGECCKMCPPGTKMTTLGSCQKPECRECEEGRYTDTYTEQQECEKQPYCDPNKKFQRAVHKSKKERTECQCQLGFHCSSESCITCVPHKVCGPGEGAAIKGDHSRDTTCQRCPDGTFSNETSWNSDCKKWTECKSGDQIQKAGTHMSDIVCEPWRSHVVAWVSVLVVVFILVCGVFIWRYRKGKSGNLKICESGWEEKPKQK
ncbi:tumor necrosis factor receptor superfamily member 5, partial [Sphaeramia orbicularis]